jgi:hypothetical protein
MVAFFLEDVSCLNIHVTERLLSFWKCETAALEEFLVDGYKRVSQTVGDALQVECPHGCIGHVLHVVAQPLMGQDPRTAWLGTCSVLFAVYTTWFHHTQYNTMFLSIY